MDILRRQVSELERSLAVAQEKYHHEQTLKDAALQALEEEKNENEALTKELGVLRTQLDGLAGQHAKQIDQLLERINGGATKR